MIPQTMKTKEDICPVCGSNELVQDYERGEIVCAACGTVVVENLVDLGPEWRDAQKARTGPPLKLASSLVTIADKKDAKGKLASIRVRLRYFKNRLNGAARELERLKNAMGLPQSCVDRALEIYRQAYEKGLTRRKSADAVIAAALYAACRTSKMPRTAAEIERYTKASRHEILRAYAAIAERLNMPKADVVDYVRVIAARLKLNAKTTNKAIEIARSIKKNMSAHVAAAVAIYMASGKRSMKEVAAAANTTTVTLRKHLYKVLERGIKLKIENKQIITA